MQLHLYIVLQRTPEQQADLDNLIARQQQRTAPEYHHWLTPQQFGARFGAHPDDIATLSKWLQSHGMKVRNVLNNASMIDFATTAGQIRDAFHTELHYFDFAGGRYAANVADPQIPAALAPLVAGIQGMVKVPMHSNQMPIAQAAYDKATHTWHKVNSSQTGQAPGIQAHTGQVNPDYYQADSGNAQFVTPQDLYTIYNIKPVLTGGDLAQTASVAVVEQSDMAYGTVDSSTGAATGGDLATFRNVFGVPGTLNMHVHHGYGKVQCSDPGIVTGDELGATIEAEWANATAPSANLVFMSCDDSPDQGALTSLQYVIDGNLADAVSLSYTLSELSATSSVYSFLDMVEAQAATQGQSIFVSAGSGGSDLKDISTTAVATSGVNVNAYSSPLVTVVGSTDFQDQFDSFIRTSKDPYWSDTNSQYYADALSYVPESAWNDTCASTLNSQYEALMSEGRILSPLAWCAIHPGLDAGDSGIVAGGGGGISTHYPVPAWQAGISGYSNSYRSSPDISSFGSDGKIYSRALLLCDSTNSVATCTSTSTFGDTGGSAFPTSYLTGVAGLLVTYTGSRQGLLNPALYALAKAQYTNSPTTCYANGQAANYETTTGLPAASCIFNDVTTSGNDVPCAPNSLDCRLYETGAPTGLFVLSGIPETANSGNGYLSGPGYDQATGIGSVNVNNLLTNWNTAFTSATKLAASSTSITTGQSTTLTATVSAGPPTGYVYTPTITGTVTFKTGSTTLGTCTVSVGSCMLKIAGASLAVGGNSIDASFGGSGTYPSSTSSLITVTVTSGNTPAALTSPASGSTLTGSSETFTWTSETGATDYELQLGSSAGASNIYSSGEIAATSATPTGLPVNGEKVYATLTTYYGTASVANTYTFTTAQAASAPTVAFDGIGSSGVFLELGLAVSSATSASPAGLGATCLWTTKTSGVVVAADNSANGGGKTDTGSAWVAWTPVSGSCSTVNSTTAIYSYLQTDAVVATRCLFNGCTIKFGGSGSASAGLIGGNSEVPLAAGVAAALNGSGGTGLAVTAAATELRPEDAEFATARALTPCGTAVASGSQYLGLGYHNGDAISSYYSGTKFNVINFALPSTYSVTTIGVAPVVVVVNGDGSTNGFGDPGLTNITTGVLANFLDGTFNQTQDALITPEVGTSEPVTTLIREPLSGAYNTVEFNAPNSQPTKTSQDVGLHQLAAAANCSGSAVRSNPMSLPAGPGFRRRAIGTSEELSESIIRANSLAYGLWSVANFKGYTNATAPNAKYLTVDGVDPIQTSYTGGTIPTTNAEIANVTLANTLSGSYPIFTAIRLVNLGASPLAAVTSVAAAAQNFAPGTTRPDFVPIGSLKINRSHFVPPAGTGQPAAASNGSGKACGSVETGGDAGGMVITKAGDFDFCYNYHNTTGVVGLRR